MPLTAKKKLFHRLHRINVLFTETPYSLESCMLFIPQLAPSKPCVKVWLFIQCALYPVSILKKERRERETVL